MKYVLAREGREEKKIRLNKQRQVIELLLGVCFFLRNSAGIMRRRIGLKENGTTSRPYRKDRLAAVYSHIGMDNHILL